MPPNLDPEEQPDRPPLPGPVRLFAAVGTATGAFDAVLRGMVSVGLGIEAICLYLGLASGDLYDALIRLGLPTPHDRPMRKAGGRGWSVYDIMRLITWRVACIHPDTIAARLSTPSLPRSANAVRAKGRRLGLKPPPRRTLRRVDLSTLIDPVPGFGVWSPYSPPSSTPPSSPAQPKSSSARSGSKTTRCGTVSGPIQMQSGPSSEPPVAPGSVAVDFARSSIVDLARASPPTHPDDNALGAFADDLPADGATRYVGQGEMPRVGILRRPAPHTPHTDDEPGSDRLCGLPPLAPIISDTILSPLALIASLDLSEKFSPEQDLTWVGKCKRIAFNEALVRLVSLRAFAGEHRQVTANILGLTDGALRTLRTRIDLPTDIKLSRKCYSYDHQRALRVLAASGCEMHREQVGGRWFWRKRGSGQRLSLYTQSLRGLIDKDDVRRFRPRISLHELFGTA